MEKRSAGCLARWSGLEPPAGQRASCPGFNYPNRKASNLLRGHGRTLYHTSPTSFSQVHQTSCQPDGVFTIFWSLLCCSQHFSVLILSNEGRVGDCWQVHDLAGGRSLIALRVVMVLKKILSSLLSPALSLLLDKRRKSNQLRYWRTWRRFFFCRSEFSYQKHVLMISIKDS